MLFIDFSSLVAQRALRKKEHHFVKEVTSAMALN